MIGNGEYLQTNCRLDVSVCSRVCVGLKMMRVDEDEIESDCERQKKSGKIFT